MVPGQSGQAQNSLPFPRPPQWVPETLGVLCLCPWLSTSSLNQLLPGHWGLASSLLLVGVESPACTPWAVGVSGAGWMNCLFCSQVSVPDSSPGATMKTEPGLGEQNNSRLFGEGLMRDQEHCP